MENEHMISTAVQSVAPFIIDLSSTRLSQTLPANHPLQQPLRDAGQIAQRAQLFTRSPQGTMTLNPDAVQHISEQNNGALGISLLTSLAPVMNTIAAHEDTVLAAIPANRQDGFRTNLVAAAVGLQNNGIAIDRRAVAAFGADTRDSVPQIQSAALEARRVVSTNALDEVRINTLNTLETLGQINMQPNKLPAGVMMQTIIDNTQQSLRNAGYMIPGDSTARTAPYSEQAPRGTREDAEQIAAAGKLLSEALNSPEGVGSFAHVQSHNTQFTALGQARITQSAEQLKQAVTSMEDEGSAIIEARRHSQMPPEAAIASIELLTAGMLVGRDATMGMHTEISEGESFNEGSTYRETAAEPRSEEGSLHKYDAGEGALSSSGRAAFERDEAQDQEGFEPGSIADSTNEAHQMGWSGEEGLHGRIDSMESITRNDPSFSTVGTAYIPQKNFKQLEHALELAADAHLGSHYDRMIPLFFGADHNATQAAQAEARLAEAEKQHAAQIQEGATPLTPEQRKNIDDQVAQYHQEYTVSAEQADASIAARNQVPFASEDDIKRMQQLLDSAERLVGSVGPDERRNDPIVVREDVLQEMDGAVARILANNSYMRVNQLAGRSLRDIEQIEEQRGTAFYSSAQEAAEAMEGRFGTEDLNSMSSAKRPDSVLGTIHIPKSEMSQADYEAFRSGPHARSVDPKNIYFFDPNKPSEDKTTGNRFGLIDMERTAKTPPSLEDIALNRSTMERAFIAKMFDEQGNVNQKFRDTMIGLTENNKSIIVAPTVNDAKMLRAAAEDAQRLFEAERTQQNTKATEHMPKSYVTLRTQDVRQFVEQIDASRDIREPKMVVRDNKIVIEHPEAKSIQVVERNTNAVKQTQQFLRRDAQAQATDIPGYVAPKAGEAVPTASTRIELGNNKMSKAFLERLASSNSPALEIELSDRMISSVRKIEAEQQATIQPKAARRAQAAER